MVDNNIIGALKIITEKLRNQQIIWSLVGSTNLALQGVKVEPNDIDILTNGKDAFKIHELLKEYEVRPVELKQLDIFESYFSELNINGVKVEIMGDLKRKIGEDWTPLIERLNKTIMIDVENVKVPVTPLEEELKAYKKLGRDKDKKKIEKILEVLGNDFMKLKEK